MVFLTIKDNGNTVSVSAGETITIELDNPTPAVELVPSASNALLWKTLHSSRTTTYKFTVIASATIAIGAASAPKPKDKKEQVLEPVFHVQLDVQTPQEPQDTQGLRLAASNGPNGNEDPDRPLMFMHGLNKAQRLAISRREYGTRLKRFEKEVTEGSTQWWLPGYKGHMNYDISVPHVDALKNVLWLNPNNCAQEASPTTTLCEMKFITTLAREVAGWNVDWRDEEVDKDVDPDSAWGYVCVGGTIANLMGLWVARNKLLQPPKPMMYGDYKEALTSCTEKIVLCNEHAHYSVLKACNLLGLQLVFCNSDENDRMVLPDDLSNVLAVVATIGSTEAGVVDDLESIIHRCRQAGVWVHADAAYGGYFKYAQADLEDPVSRNAFGCLGEADSITIDPHKCGYAPYPTAVFMLQRKADREFVDCANGAPYIHGKVISAFTVEGSRSGAFVAAEYFAHEVLQPSYQTLMRDVLAGAKALKEELRKSPERFEVYPHTDLGMVMFSAKPHDYQARYMSMLSDWQNTHTGQCHGLTVATTEYKTKANAKASMFRIVVMDPNFKDYVPKFVNDLKHALNDLDAAFYDKTN
eukprot:m51a1_g7305 putative glutamate decarboxylase (583) ;mRNA; r:98087-100137